MKRSHSPEPLTGFAPGADVLYRAEVKNYDFALAPPSAYWTLSGNTPAVIYGGQTPDFATMSCALGAGNYVQLQHDSPTMRCDIPGMGPVFYHARIRMLSIASGLSNSSNVGQDGARWFVGMASTNTDVLNDTSLFRWVGFLKETAANDSLQRIRLVSGTDNSVGLDGQTVLETGWSTLDPRSVSTEDSRAGTRKRRAQQKFGVLEWIDLAFRLDPIFEDDLTEPSLGVTLTGYINGVEVASQKILKTKGWPNGSSVAPVFAVERDDAEIQQFMFPGPLYMREYGED